MKLMELYKERLDLIERQIQRFFDKPTLHDYTELVCDLNHILGQTTAYGELGIPFENREPVIVKVNDMLIKVVNFFATQSDKGFVTRGGDCILKIILDDTVHLSQSYKHLTDKEDDEPSIQLAYLVTACEIKGRVLEASKQSTEAEIETFGYLITNILAQVESETIDKLSELYINTTGVDLDEVEEMEIYSLIIERLYLCEGDEHELFEICSCAGMLEGAMISGTIDEIGANTLTRHIESRLADFKEVL